MKYRALFLVLVTLAACKTTTSLRQGDLARLDGKWELACSGPIGQPNALECPEIAGYQQISCDPAQGSGKFHYQLPGETLDVNFRLMKEDKKWFIYYMDGQGNASKGEIVRLDEKELVLHYAKEGMMTVQRRSE
jgi:hypothetical protein